MPWREPEQTILEDRRVKLIMAHLVEHGYWQKLKIDFVQAFV